MGAAVSAQGPEKPGEVMHGGGADGEEAAPGHTQGASAPGRETPKCPGGGEGPVYLGNREKRQCGYKHTRRKRK